MDNLGKAIYMAAGIFLFIVAATTSIYLYGTLDTYLDISANTISMDKRAETKVIDGSKKVRDITRSEIYITIFNMEQMHVDKLTVNLSDGSYTIEPNDVIENNIKVTNLVRSLDRSSSTKYTYSSNNREVTYTYRNS